MERLKAMKDTMLSVVQTQMGNLAQVDAKELGEAVDIIKDLSEAEYYCSIVKAMEEKEKEPKNMPMYYTEPYHPYYDHYRDMDRDNGRMYYTSNGRSANNDGNRSTSSMSDGRSYNDGTRYYTEPYPIEVRDHREGRSPLRRKSYMESKELHHPKETQMKELEDYLKELGHDIMDMITEATPEEKQILQKKITELAGKIK